MEEAQEKLLQRAEGCPAHLRPCCTRRAPAPLQALQILLAIPACPHSWHCVKPQRFQEPGPCFREARDKVISPRTHRGWVPCCPSLPETRRGPCQNSKQTVTQQRKRNSVCSSVPGRLATACSPSSPSFSGSVRGVFVLKPLGLLVTFAQYTGMTPPSQPSHSFLFPSQKHVSQAAGWGAWGREEWKIPRRVCQVGCRGKTGLRLGAAAGTEALGWWMHPACVPGRTCVCVCVCTHANGTHRPLFLHTYLRRRSSADLNTWNTPLTVTSTFERQQCREADSSPWGSSIRGALHHPKLFPSPRLPAGPDRCPAVRAGVQGTNKPP